MDIPSIFQRHFPFLKLADIDQLCAIGQLESYTNKARIHSAGQKAETLYFLLQGTVRGYLIEENGEERTVFIRPSYTFFGAPELLQNQAVSKYFFEAIQETELLALPFTAFEALAKSNLAIANLYMEALKENLLILVFRVEILAGKPPEERYDILMDRYPQLFQNAPHKYIANYLGITPNSLSRIIKRKTSGS